MERLKPNLASGNGDLGFPVPPILLLPEALIFQKAYYFFGIEMFLFLETVCLFMPTSRLLRTGKYMKRYGYSGFSHAVKEEADKIAKGLRSEGRNAVVRKGGKKWDIFTR